MWWNTQPPWTQTAFRGAPRRRPPVGPRVAVRGMREQRTRRDGRSARGGAPHRARVGARAVGLRRRDLLARLRPAGLLRLAAGLVTSLSCRGGVLRRRGGRPRAVRGPPDLRPDARLAGSEARSRARRAGVHVCLPGELALQHLHRVGYRPGPVWPGRVSAARAPDRGGGSAGERAERPGAERPRSGPPPRTL